VTVTIPVQLFARYREAVGRGRVEVEIPDGATVEDAWRALTTVHPVLTRYRPHTLFAVGNEYVGPERALRPGDELACFPPVSGGRSDVPRQH
jgi:molybdopterin converting factor small subunit